MLAMTSSIPSVRASAAARHAAWVVRTCSEAKAAIRADAVALSVSSGLGSGHPAGDAILQIYAVQAEVANPAAGTALNEALRPRTA